MDSNTSQCCYCLEIRIICADQSAVGIYLQPYKHTLCGVCILWNSTHFVHSKYYYKFKNKFRLFLFIGILDLHSARLHILFLVLNGKKILEKTLGRGFQAQLSYSEKSIHIFHFKKNLVIPLVLPFFHFQSSVMEQHETILLKTSPFSNFFCTAVAGRRETTVRSKQIGTSNQNGHRVENKTQRFGFFSSFPQKKLHPQNLEYIQALGNALEINSMPLNTTAVEINMTFSNNKAVTNNIPRICVF